MEDTASEFEEATKEFFLFWHDAQTHIMKVSSRNKTTEILWVELTRICQRKIRHGLFLCSAGNRLSSPLTADSYEDLKENTAAADWDLSASTSSDW